MMESHTGVSSQITKKSEITGIDVILIYPCKAILQVIYSGYPVNLKEFSKYTFQITESYKRSTLQMPGIWHKPKRSELWYWLMKQAYLKLKKMTVEIEKKKLENKLNF